MSDKNITTNYLIIETALAAYAVLEDHMLLAREELPDGHPFKEVDDAITKWCENSGAAEMRRAAWSMAEDIEAIWRKMSPGERDGEICWDFEFVPQLMTYCFKWDTQGYPHLINPNHDATVAAFRMARETVAAFDAAKAVTS